MDYFGINSPVDLPKLKEIFNEGHVDPTIINNDIEQFPFTETAEDNAEMVSILNH